MAKVYLRRVGEMESIRKERRQWMQSITSLPGSEDEIELAEVLMLQCNSFK